MEEIEHGNKKQARCPFFDRGGWRKWTKQTRISQSGSFFVSHLSQNKYGKRIILKNVPNPPTPSFVEPCIVSDPNLPGASLPQRQVKLVSRMMGNYLLRFGEDSAVSQNPLGFGVDPFTLFYYIRLAKRMFFDTPRTWILYEPMDRDKSLLLAMTSSFITSSFPYPSPLFSVTHQMALSSYL